MVSGQRPKSDNPARQARERRLKAALRANMKRRKAQARARAQTLETGSSHDSAGIVPDKR
jgi:hypothetical protein